MVKIVTGSRRADMMAQGIRDLFAAGWLGEQMFAQLGLHRAVKVLNDPRERSKVIGASWKAERPFGRAVELGLAGMSLYDLYRAVKGRRWYDVAASAAALGAVGSSVGNEISGRAVGRADGDQGTPIDTGFSSNEDTPEAARVAQNVLKVLVPVGLGLAAASIALSIFSRSADD